MTQMLSAWKRRRASAADESGFTLIEIVVAIPIVFLVLGLVFSSVGVSLGLMGQVTKSAGAARTAIAVVDELDSARSCAEVRSIVNRATAANAHEKYAVSFSEYSCTDRTPFKLELTVKEAESNRVYFSKSMTLAAM